MPRLAILTGAALVLLGIVFFFLQEGSRSATALIPSFIGILIVIGGVIAKNPARTKAGMHAAVGFAALGAIGSLMGAAKWPTLLSGGEVARPLAAWAQLFTFLICGFFVARSVQWFANNRRAKAEAHTEA